MLRYCICGVTFNNRRRRRSHAQVETAHELRRGRGLKTLHFVYDYQSAETGRQTRPFRLGHGRWDACRGRAASMSSIHSSSNAGEKGRGGAAARLYSSHAPPLRLRQSARRRRQQWGFAGGILKIDPGCGGRGERGQRQSSHLRCNTMPRSRQGYCCTGVRMLLLRVNPPPPRCEQRWQFHIQVQVTLVRLPFDLLDYLDALTVCGCVAVTVGP